MTFHIGYAEPEARPADKARVLAIARALGMPDEVLLMLGLVGEGSEPVQGRRGRILTANQVLEIRRLRASKTTAELVEMFGVTDSTVTDIVARRTWKSLA